MWMWKVRYIIDEDINAKFENKTAIIHKFTCMLDTSEVV